jgi:maltooligosyltrehalose trehalohydrolase
MSEAFVSKLLGASTRNFGATVQPDGVGYTIWAPERHKAEVVVVDSQGGTLRTVALKKTADGYFSATDPDGRAGDLYTITVDDHAELPDLASRFQPKGLMGPSMVVDPSAYQWQAKNWKRPAWRSQVVYELHIGTFTREGTYRAAIERLDYLTALGVTVIEIMPLAECIGERNWGYDGVLLFAPYHPYGSPDDLRTFVDACHLRGLAVMLDVVYNHIGAIGDHTDFYSKHYSHPENTGAWGKGFNLHGDHSAPVRHLLLQNIDYWLDEFRFDGFRLDATHAIRDESEKHLLVQGTEIIHSYGAFVTGEDERNTAEILKPRSEGGWQLDAVWADDFHHTIRVSQTHETHSYLGRFSGSLDEIAETITNGWFFRGQPHPKLTIPRGTPSIHLSPRQFIYCISNHDQVGNRAFGERLHHMISPEAYRAVSLFFCLIPYTPMLFMGQEWATTAPFLFFTNHPDDFGRLVTEGRAREFQFDAKQHHAPLPNCQEESTFINSKVNWDEIGQQPHSQVLALYREALKQRRNLFGSDNPSRSTWKVEARVTHLAVIYELAARTVEVCLWLTEAAPGDVHEGKILLRSNDPRFGGDSKASTPETVVKELK